jgi:hypothetical protein
MVIVPLKKLTSKKFLSARRFLYGHRVQISQIHEQIVVSCMERLKTCIAGLSSLLLNWDAKHCLVNPKSRLKQYGYL